MSREMRREMRLERLELHVETPRYWLPVRRRDAISVWNATPEIEFRVQRSKVTPWSCRETHSRDAHRAPARTPDPEGRGRLRLSAPSEPCLASMPAGPADARPAATPENNGGGLSRNLMPVPSSCRRYYYCCCCGCCCCCCCC